MTSVPPAESTSPPQAELVVPAEPTPGKAIVLAWTVSILWHTAMFAAMFLMPWLADFAGPADDLPIARTDLLGELTQARVTSSARPTFNTDTTSTTTNDPQLKPKRFESLTQPVSAARPELSIIGIGTGGGGDFSKYGLRAGSGPGPSFFGLGKRARGARRIVYVVDRSGSMLTTFEAVRRELRSSIGKLRRSQRFHVIFFNAGEPLENRPKKLVPATASQKKELLEFLDAIQPERGTDPIPAMRRAFAVKPDLIYFLTDGDFDPLLLEKLREWNKDHGVRIFTLAYVSQAGRVLLEQIARENNGEFKFISEHDIL
ncbi:MAG: VWA domain-containing protein [Planctomycetota bacterium]